MKRYINNEKVKINKTVHLYCIDNEETKILKDIKKIVRNIQQLKNLSIKLDYYKYILELQLTTSEKFCTDNQYLLYSTNLLINKNKNSIIKNIEELRETLKMILKSDLLKKKFNINGNINDKELNVLINDIVNSIFVLTFEKDEEISNFIFLYIKKFIS